MKKRLLVTVVLVALVMTSLIGCTKKEVTLESFVKDNPSEEAALEQLTADDPNAQIEFEGNLMRIIYNVEDENITKDILDSAMDMMEDIFNGIAQDLVKSTGIEGIQIEVLYQKADGEEITRRIFE
ncbi:MAG: DUF4854 domain-containing protein [Firmicutes bacterium]|nr:DUF4854 domain-containing protein [Bacillota bacterium]